MSDLSNQEKRKLEKLLGMSSGYVLSFSNRTFDEFVFDCTQREIYDTRYDHGSGSKANRLRAFWAAEPSHVVGKLLAELLQHYEEETAAEYVNAPLLEACKRIAIRLCEAAPVQDLDAIEPITDAREFDLLARAVRECIERHEPETGLDRLHAFLVKYVRTLCEARGISTEREKPLHSLFGEYVKALREADQIKSQMADRILRSSISTLEAFNAVRNDQSLAHDNTILGYDESLFILNHIASVVRFVRDIEAAAVDHRSATEEPEGWADVPF